MSEPVAPVGAGGPSSRATWLLFVSLTGYPLAGTLAAMTSLPSAAASVPIRLLMIGLSLSLLFTFRLGQPLLVALRLQRLSALRAALLAFWVLYVARLLWDWQAAGLQEAGPSLLFAMVVGILPALAFLVVERDAWDVPRLARLFCFGGGLTCAAAVGAELSGLAGARSLTEVTGRLSFDTVNPITYGQVAATTALAAAALWFQPGLHASRTGKLLAAAAAAIALVCLQMSGSKGPLVALVLSLLGGIVLQRRLRRKLVYLLPVAALAGYIALDSPLTQRLVNAEEDLSTIERRELLANAIDQFQRSPVLGSAYVERELETYPHNPVVEAAMATGVPGLTLYALVVLGTLALLPALISREDTSFLALVAAQYLVAEHISGSLWASGGLWISIALVLSLARRGVAVTDDALPLQATS